MGRPPRPDGRVMEMLSEHQCQGWLEGYLLTGRHGFFSCYEAFIHIIDSMFNQHAKWLKVCNEIPGDGPSRRELPAVEPRLAAGPQRLQPPGPRVHRSRRQARRPRWSASTCRLMPTACSRSPTTACAAGTTSTSWSPASSRPAVVDHGRGDQALRRRARDLGMGQQRPWCGADVVMACCGDVPTLETLAAVDLLRLHAPELKVRVINVVNLMKLQPPKSTRTASRITTSTRCSPRTSRSSSPSTATPG